MFKKILLPFFYIKNLHVQNCIVHNLVYISIFFWYLQGNQFKLLELRGLGFSNHNISSVACAGFILAGAEKNISWGRKKNQV